MTEQEIKAEHDRLSPIVFEGAPDLSKWASMGRDGIWHCHGVEINDSIGYFHPRSWLCKNQPETTLDWTQTLIERGDE